MLPTTIVGSIVYPDGPKPFVLEVASGKVTVGRHADPDPFQAQMAPEERRAAENRVRSETGGAREVRLGVFACPLCRRFVDVVGDPSHWRGDRCDRCA